MPRERLGLYGVDRVSRAMIEVADGAASLPWLQIGDSNLGQNGGGYGYCRRVNIGQVLRIPQIATGNVTAGLFTGQQIAYSSDGNTTDYACDTLRSVGNGGQGDQFHLDDYTHAEVSPVLQPFLPTMAAMVAVDIFVPMMPEPGDQLGSCRYNFIHQTSDPYGYDFEERFQVWICHPRESTLGSHPWQVRQTTSSTNITNGTVDQSPTGAPTGTAEIAVEMLADVAAGSPWLVGSSLSNGEVLQFMPYGNLQTPAGTPGAGPHTMILSMFATWPDRGHGYLVSPIIYDGGGSLGEYVSAIADAENEWTDWKLIAAAAAMMGNRAHMVIEIQHLLNDNTDEATFLTRLTAASEHLLARFDALKADGRIPSTVVSCTILFSGCNHRMPTSIEDIRYGYNAARTLADSNSRVVVADFQDMALDGYHTAASDGGAHLSSDAHYLANDRRWVSRFFCACRMDQQFREAS